MKKYGIGGDYNFCIIYFYNNIYLFIYVVQVGTSLIEGKGAAAPAT